jgi:NADPH:quinone reductase-like Zn-dependent oxidoreductase
LARSYRSIAFGGKIALIGFLAAPVGDEGVNPFALMPKGASLQGIGVGSTRMFEDMNRAMQINGIIPIVDRVYDFDHASDAIHRLASREFVGKIVVTV